MSESKKNRNFAKVVRVVAAVALAGGAAKAVTPDRNPLPGSDNSTSTTTESSNTVATPTPDIYDRYSKDELKRMALNGEIQVAGASDDDNPPSRTGESQVVDPSDQ